MLLSAIICNNKTHALQDTMADAKNHSSLRAVKAFAGHAIAGTAIFLILALVAFGIGKFIKLLERHGADAALINVLTTLEYIILAADALSMLFFLWSAVCSAYKEMKE